MAKGNKIFAETYYEPFDDKFLHRMYSVSKSFVSVAVGLAMTQGLIKLDDKIVDYFITKSLDEIPVWAETYMISFATNGTLMEKPEVQRFIKKYKTHLSVSVSIDGTKEISRWAFEAKEGAVSSIFTINNNYFIVAAVTGVHEEGYTPVSEVSSSIRNILYNEKAAEKKVAEIKSEIRDTLGKFLYDQTKRRPVVLPVVMEVRQNDFRQKRHVKPKKKVEKTEKID